MNEDRTSDEESSRQPSANRGGSDGGKAGDGYRMPAEWEPHVRTWLSWPHNPETWPGLLPRIPPIWGEMVRGLRETEEVAILSRDDTMDAAVSRELGGDLSGVRLVRVPTQDAWIRDYGPIFVQDRARSGRQVLLDWGFNSWGGKYPPWDLDDAVPRALGQILDLPVITPGMVLEGGSIEVDGEGTLLTTESCLLNGNRNPELSREDIEARLRRYLGVDRVLWLGDGIRGDDTDGHVDDLTRFIAPGKVVTAVESDPRDDNYRPLQENLERLRGMRDARGRRLDVVELPMPPPIVHEGTRCPASYANFLIGNGCVLLPTFRNDRDARALGALQELFPSRRVVGVHCEDMVWGLGAIHCVTQQQPTP